MFDLEDEGADIDVRVELFADLPLKRLRVRFACTDLAAGKLPLPGEMCSFEPPRQQKGSVPFDHGGNDDNHLEKLWRTLGDNAFTQAIEDSIVKTAKVTARLYRLQLEELGNA